METVIVIDIPVNEALCLNNCSNRGNCSNFGICLCEEGYFGRDCSLGIIIHNIIPTIISYMVVQTNGSHQLAISFVQLIL